MGKIWLKGPDTGGNCCGCEGKVSPCDSCCKFIIPYGDDSFTETNPYADDAAPSLAAASEVIALYTKECKIYFPPLYSYRFPINIQTSINNSVVSVNSTIEYGFPGPATFFIESAYAIKISLSESTTLRFDFNTDSADILVYTQSGDDILRVTNQRASQWYEATYNAGQYVILFIPTYVVFGGQTTNLGSLTFISSITAKNNKNLNPCPISMWYMDGLEKKFYTCEES